MNMVTNMTENDKKCAELRDCAHSLIGYADRVRDAARAGRDFYRGIAPQTQPPPKEQRLDYLLNPERSDLHVHLTNFAAALKRIPPGQHAADILQPISDAFESLIENELSACWRTRENSIVLTALATCGNYLRDVSCDMSPDVYARMIDVLVAQLSESLTLLAHAFYDRMCAVLASQPKPQAKKIGKLRKNSGLKGTRTRTMRQQYEDFESFIIGKPIVDHHQGKTVEARAKQFWHCHAAAYDLQAQANGENRGYSSPKALARAYRDSRR